MNNVLFWLGAGQAVVPNINFADFDSVVLVEARIEQVLALSKRFSSNDNVEIVHRVVFDKAEKSDYYRYSLDEYSALSSTSGLQELYPGLRLSRREEVKTCSFAELLSEFTDPSVSITLVLDMVDVNYLILKSIVNSEHWQKVTEIYLPIPNFSLYEGAATASELVPLLESQGFILLDTDINDPDIPVAKLNRNPMWFELASLKKQQELHNIQQQKEIKEYKRKLQTHVEELTVEKERATQTSDLIATLENNNSTLESQVEQLKSDKQQLIDKQEEAKLTHEGQYQELLNQIDELKTRANDFEQTISRLNTEKSELLEQVELFRVKNQKIEDRLVELKNNSSELAALRIELKEILEQRDEQAHWHQENKKWAESLNVKCEELRIIASDREKSTTLALKLQTKAQLDLADLQDKYRTKHLNEQNLVGLIKELREKLQQASEFYSFLKDNHPEICEIEFTNSKTISDKKSLSIRDSES